MGEMVEVDAG